MHFIQLPLRYQLIEPVMHVFLDGDGEQVNIFLYIIEQYLNKTVFNE